MNGVLAKPFTKEGMSKCVRNHLSHLMKAPPADTDLSGAGYYMGGAYLNTSTSLKFETPTPPPPGTTGSGWSPAQLPQSSTLGASLDSGFGFSNGGNQYAMATGRTNYSGTMQSADSSSGRLSDIDSPPEKRQRLNPSGGY
jgi:osomolarity two-component system response regulator SKN7